MQDSGLKRWAVALQCQSTSVSMASARASGAQAHAARCASEGFHQKDQDDAGFVLGVLVSSSPLGSP